MAQGLTSEVYKLQLGGSPTLNSPTHFDGRNVWFTSTTSGVHRIYVVEFWGPYLNLDNTENLRWAEPTVDNLTIGSMGPKLVLVATIMINKIVKQFVRFESGIVTVICSDGNWIRINESTYSIIDTVLAPIPNYLAPGTWAGPFLDENGSTYTSNSKWVLTETTSRNYLETPNHYFVVRTHPTQQYGSVDLQKIYRYNKSTGAYLGFGYLGSKQTEVRYLAYNAGKVYVSAFNRLGVNVYDDVTGGQLAFINVNRDVEEMFEYGGDIYVSSRNGLFSRISKDGTVTDIGNQGVRDYYIAKLGSPMAPEVWYNITLDELNKYDAGATSWFVYEDDTLLVLAQAEKEAADAAKVITAANLEANPHGGAGHAAAHEADQAAALRVAAADANLAAVIAAGNPKGAQYYRKDTRMGKKFNLYARDIQSVAFVPEFKYEYLINNSLSMVTIPAHLIFLKSNGELNAVRFPGLYKGGINKSYGGLMAISTGQYRYKGDKL